MNKRNRSRRSSNHSPFESLCEVGDKYREKHGEVRHVTIVEHTGRQWTLIDRWEVKQDGEWVELDWTEFDWH